ncbi:hypothetical protein X777_06341 [Ooceraea biroi]|uniref:Uncharacterized protein n=1 Tax=Ooceraea biroi TaxID=2015173 RepID=A0A026WAY1_OOCBI|nr:hypothetical protein X777_06341 [Ooceraea biroi]
MDSAHVLSKPESKKRKFDRRFLLTSYKMKDFLYKIIIGDEKWISYDNLKRRKL